MLRNVAVVITGVMLLGAGAYVVSLHRTSEEPLRSLVLFTGTMLLLGGIATVIDGLFRKH